MKRIMAVLAVIGLALTCGCASIYTVHRHDTTAMARNVLKVEANQGGFLTSVDLLSLNTGYWQTWKDNPWQMAGSTLLDAGTTAAASYGAYRLYERGRGGSSSDPKAATGAQSAGVPSGMSIGGSGNIVVIGQGNNVTVPTLTTTTSGGVE